MKNPESEKFRKMGIVVCLGVLAISLSICFILARDIMKGPSLLQVNFTNVGTLILQEPVAMDGVEIGRVAKIEYTPENALVTLEFYKRISLPKDSRIINFNHSLMGSRMIFIYRGTSSENMDFSQIQKGTFSEGIAEMLHRTGEVLEMVQRYHALAYDLKHGNDSMRSVPEVYLETIVPIIDTYRATLAEALKMENLITRRIAAAEDLSTDLKKMARRAGSSLEDISSATLERLGQINTTLNDIDTLAASAETLVKKISQGENPIHNVIYKRDLFEKMESLNKSLNNMVIILKADGIQDIINFWKNVKILGTNPTKKQPL